MSDFSINEQMKAKEEILKVENTQHTEVAEGPQHGHGTMPQITLDNVDTYKIAVRGMREKLLGLVQEGFLTEVVAERLMTDFMFNTFNQVVKPKLG